MTKHEIILYWSNEDQAFIAEVPELGLAAQPTASLVRTPLPTSKQ
jgi:predicted RNase H-like HicB family nuclease